MRTKKNSVRKPRFLSYILKSIATLGERHGSSFHTLVDHVQRKMKQIHHDVPKKTLAPYIKRAVQYGVRHDILKEAHGKFQFGSSNLKGLPLESSQLCSIVKKATTNSRRESYSVNPRVLKSIGKRPTPRRYKKVSRRRKAEKKPRRRRRPKIHPKPRCFSPHGVVPKKRSDKSVPGKASSTAMSPKPNERQRMKSISEPKSERYLKQPRGRSPVRPHKDKSGPPLKPNENIRSKFADVSGKNVKRKSNSALGIVRSASVSSSDDSCFSEDDVF